MVPKKISERSEVIHIALLLWTDEWYPRKHQRGVRSSIVLSFWGPMASKRTSKKNEGVGWREWIPCSISGSSAKISGSLRTVCTVEGTLQYSLNLSEHRTDFNGRVQSGGFTVYSF